MSESHDQLEAEHEALIELLYLCPFAVARINERGDIDLMNSMGAQLFMQFVKQPVLENLFSDVLDPVAPELRSLVVGFVPDQGPICEGHRVYIGRPGGRELPLVLSFTFIKLSPGAIMVAVSDISRIEYADREKGVLLSNISDGLVSLDRAGRMSSERSSAMTRWLGSGRAGQTFWEYIAPFDAHAADNFEMGWGMLWEDQLPLELCLDQMPQRLITGEVALRITYKPLFEDGKLSHIMLVLSDMTSELARERLEEEQQELMTAVNKLARDRAGFREFFAESTAILQSLGESRDLTEQKRLLHTLKGNSSVFGLRTMSALCHDIEEHVAEQGRLDGADTERLRQRWTVLSERFASLIGDSGGRIEIGPVEYGALISAIRGGQPRQQIMERVTEWLLQPVESRLLRYAAQIRELGQRLGKGAVEVTVDAGGLRHSAEQMGPFWSAFTHAVRNAVDHGLETEDERKDAGKGAPPRVWLLASLAEDLLVIEIKDDGRGIDWEAVGRRARERGLPVETQTDLVNALFADGVSTKEEATEFSGRGVGVGALRAACEALGGRVEVDSARGIGTTFRFCIPRRVTLPAIQGGQSRPLRTLPQ